MKYAIGIIIAFLSIGCAGRSLGQQPVQSAENREPAQEVQAVGERPSIATLASTHGFIYAEVDGGYVVDLASNSETDHVSAWIDLTTASEDERSKVRALVIGSLHREIELADVDLISFPNLQKLSVYGVANAGDFISDASDLGSLWYLRIVESPIDTLSDEMVPASLRTLSLRATGLRDIGLAATYPLLRNLTIYSNELVSLDGLSRFPNLEEVRLADLPRLSSVVGIESGKVRVVYLDEDLANRFADWLREYAPEVLVNVGPAQ